MDGCVSLAKSEISDESTHTRQKGRVRLWSCVSAQGTGTARHGFSWRILWLFCTAVKPGQLR